PGATGDEVMAFDFLVRAARRREDARPLNRAFTQALARDTVQTEIGIGARVDNGVVGTEVTGGLAHHFANGREPLQTGLQRPRARTTVEGLEMMRQRRERRDAIRQAINEGRYNQAGGATQEPRQGEGPARVEPPEPPRPVVTVQSLLADPNLTGAQVVDFVTANRGAPAAELIRSLRERRDSEPVLANAVRYAGENDRYKQLDPATLAALTGGAQLSPFTLGANAGDQVSYNAAWHLLRGDYVRRTPPERLAPNDVRYAVTSMPDDAAAIVTLTAGIPALREATLAQLHENISASRPEAAIAFLRRLHDTPWAAPMRTVPSPLAQHLTGELFARGMLHDQRVRLYQALVAPTSGTAMHPLVLTMPWSVYEPLVERVRASSDYWGPLATRDLRTQVAAARDAWWEQHGPKVPISQ
ncbi:MAG TPA: hypothetical protein VLC93_06510, partial [Myxococcota bacterium]|nr:hypothetical protein [Myxococcota bacterium]